MELCNEGENYMARLEGILKLRGSVGRNNVLQDSGRIYSEGERRSGCEEDFY